MGETRFHRGVGLVVLAVVGAAAALLLIVVAASEPPPLWDPAQATLAGVWTVLYNTQLPSSRVLLGAVAVALLVGAAIALTERAVTNRYRRSPATVQRRTLTPRRNMEEPRARTRTSEPATLLKSVQYSVVRAELPQLGRQSG